MKPALLEDSVESGLQKGGWGEGVTMTQQRNESQVCKGKVECDFSKETHNCHKGYQRAVGGVLKVWVL